MLFWVQPSASCFKLLGDHFRLVWAGTALGAGPLPAAFRKKSSPPSSASLPRLSRSLQASANQGDLPLKLTMVRQLPACRDVVMS